jgi:hypothetical protein
MVSGLPNLPTELRMTRALPAVLVLFYPTLIWVSSTWAPVLVLLALCLPLACACLAHRIAVTQRFPVSTGIALFAVGAPALYSLMGGWLDFQKVLPFHANAAWYVLWTAAAVFSVLERPAGVTEQTQVGRSLAFAHGFSAMLIALFAAVHLTNHMFGIVGGEAHKAFMTTARTVYRQWFVEVPLIAAVAFQVSSGILLLIRRIRSGMSDVWSTVQAASGAYMLMFFLSHVSAVGRARYLRHTDTNWRWLTADDLLTDPWSARLLPYYVLGVLAFGLHLACGVRAIAQAHGRSERFTVTVFAATFGSLALISVVIATALIRGSHRV